MNEPLAEDVYAERARVVVMLARMARALGHRVGFKNDPESPGWPVLYIEGPTGQMSWHFSDADRWKYAPDIGEFSGAWDTHCTVQKYVRLEAWGRSLGQ